MEPTPPLLGPKEGEVVTIGNNLRGILVHTTHRKLIYCGGYAGCTTCCLYASTNGTNNKLKLPCRGAERTHNIGHRQEINNLKVGKIPHEHASRRRNNPHAWPTGESDPMPRTIFLQ